MNNYGAMPNNITLDIQCVVNERVIQKVPDAGYMCLRDMEVEGTSAERVRECVRGCGEDS